MQIPPNAQILTILFSLFLLAGGSPLNLREALREALDKSDEAELLREQKGRLQWVIKETKSALYPQISSFARAAKVSTPVNPSQFNQPGNLFRITFNQYTYGVEGTQPLYSFGRLSQALKVAEIHSEAAEQTSKRGRQEMERRTLDSFLRVLEARTRLRVMESSIERQRKAAEQLNNNFNMGSGSKAEVLLAASAVKSLEPVRIRMERDVETSLMELKSVLGRELESPLDLDTSQIYDMDWKLDNETGLYQKAIVERADLKFMDLQAEAIHETARLQILLNRPTLGIQGKFGILAYDPGQLAHWENREWQVGIGFSWPLFDGFEKSSRSGSSRSEYRAVKLQSAIQKKQVQVEVESAYRENMAADKAVTAAQEALMAAQEAQALITVQFGSGGISLTELLNAEDGLRRAEMTLIENKNNRLRAQAALRLSLGLSLSEGN